MSSKPDYRIEYVMRYERAGQEPDVKTFVNPNCTTRKSFDDAMSFYASNKNCISYKSLGGIKWEKP